MSDAAVLIERFHAKVIETDDGCWCWQGALTYNGYGQFWDGTKTVRAHRWSYQHYVGAIPEGLTIDHLCKNPACVKPTHLEAVTIRENVLRGTGPSAINAAKNRCDNGHEFNMQRGIDDEPRAAEKYAEVYAPVRPSGFMVRDFGDYKLGYSPDGLVGDDGLIEVKSKGPKRQVPTVLKGTVPEEHMAQIQAGLMVSGRQWCDFISYCGGMAFWVVRVEPDEQWFDAIDEAATAAEAAIRQMVADYEAATKGLPMTERSIVEVVI